MKLLVLTFSVLMLIACSPAPENDQKDNLNERDTTVVASEPNPYDVNDVYDASTRDSLLANMVTYIYKKPNRATAQTRTNPEFRAYYVEHMRDFEWAYYHISPDSTHYYYLIRPARSMEGNLRGVGGKFRLDENMNFIDFEETYNTRIKSRTELLSVGKDVFKYHIENDHITEFQKTTDLIEWPDQRLKYNKELREWRYDS